MQGLPVAKVSAKPARGPAVRQYDAKKVEKLDAALLEALKEATNIRNLKPDQSIAVAVLGYRGVVADVYVIGGKAVLKRSGGVPEVQRSVLTIHVKKSDVDAFAKGEVTPEEFRGRATVLAYCGDKSALQVSEGAEKAKIPPIKYELVPTEIVIEPLEP